MRRVIENLVDRAERSVKFDSILVFLLAGLLLAGVACQKESPRVALNDGLSAAMSDGQILRVLKLDPATLHSEKNQGPDGYTMIYTDEQHEIWITRSVVSGIIVMRMKPKEDLKTWELGKP